MRAPPAEIQVLQNSTGKARNAGDGGQPVVNSIPGEDVNVFSYIVYMLILFTGVFFLVTSLATTCAHVLRGGTRADNPYRRILGIAHGLAAFLILLGGFGMLARLGIVQGGLPIWIDVKLGIWLILSFALFLAYRGRHYARLVLVAAPILAVLAAAVALYKPF
jgi:hypothetical protein